MIFFLWLRFRIGVAWVMHTLIGTIYIYLEAYDQSLRVRAVYRDPITKRVRCRDAHLLSWVTLESDGQTSSSLNKRWFPLFPSVLPITSNDQAAPEFQ